MRQVLVDMACICAYGWRLAVRGYVYGLGDGEVELGDVSVGGEGAGEGVDDGVDSTV